VARILALVACVGFGANVLAALVLQAGHMVDHAPGFDSRAALPNYRDIDWADTHFREFLELEIAHHSYVGWRRLPYRGETINIDENGTRRTYVNPDASPARTVAFFGGSTMWGSGSDDEHTIPSAFAKRQSEYRALNFGETAHTAHQNLNALVQVLAEGLRPDVVVFYNGSSEVNKCRLGLSAFATTDEPEIRELLDRKRQGLDTGEAFRSIFQPVRMLAARAQRSISARLFGAAEPRDCSDDRAKAESIARALFWDWLAAKYLVEGYGGRFVAALQPVAYFSRTRKDHIKIDRDLQEEYETLYSFYDALRPGFPSLQDNFLDLRPAFDRDAYIYIDADHAGPNGNAIIAAAIGDYLSR
jgi:lysophospholipase L1-like esterase